MDRTADDITDDDEGVEENQFFEEIDKLTDAITTALTRYVKAMPELVDEAMKAAEKSGVADGIRPIFETALAYVEEEVDFIPDSHGIAGLVDDAYLVHGLMQEISHRHRALTGAELLGDEYFRETQRVRRLIGEPTATRLDVAIVAFARRHNIKDTIEQIFRRIGNTGMSMNLPVSVAFPAGNDDIEDLPDLELGSIGE